MAGQEEWKKNADTHKMSPETVKNIGVEASKRPPGSHPGNVLHQRRSLPFSPIQMTLAGFFIASTIGYFVLYVKAKHEASARDVAKVASGASSRSGDRSQASK